MPILMIITHNAEQLCLHASGALPHVLELSKASPRITWGVSPGHPEADPGPAFRPRWSADPDPAEREAKPKNGEEKRSRSLLPVVLETEAIKNPED